MKKSKRIKRHPSLQPISRQHHFGLLFAWKIRKGLVQGVLADRMVAYRDWFFRTEISPHFEIEEKYIFKLLASNNQYVKQALKEHQSLKKLFQAQIEIFNSLNQLEKDLTSHIRFEERILFKEIEQNAQPEELKLINKIHIHDANKSKEFHDPFWL